MTQMMKPSVVAYNKRRKRNEGQGYNGKISELRRVAYIATPTPQYMESSKCCAPSVVTILALIHLEKIGI